MKTPRRVASARPTVLVVTPDFPPAKGGIQLLQGKLVETLDRIDARVTTLKVDGDVRVDNAACGRDVRRVAAAAFWGQRAAVGILNFAAMQEAVSLRPSVVLSGHITVSSAARAIKRIFGIDYVQYAYGAELVRRPALAEGAMREAAAVLAISRYASDLAQRRGADLRRIRLIPPGVDPPARPLLGRRGGRIVVIVSRLDDRYKGHDVLIRAMPLVTSRFADARLIAVGQGNLRATYENLARACGIEGNVEFVGSVDDAGRERLLSEARVFAMPSRLPPDGGGEGFGIAYLEAGVHGLPVVAGNVAGALDSVVHERTGLLVDPADHVAVADAIIELLADPAKAERLGRGGAARAQEFSWQRMTHQVEDVLLDVIGRAG